MQNEELQNRISEQIKSKVMSELNIPNLEKNTINAAIANRLDKLISGSCSTTRRQRRSETLSARLMKVPIFI
jgi:hypothetical protein